MGDSDNLQPTLTESQKIALNQITLNTRVNEHETDIQNLNRVVLLGNGELPLRERVRTLEKIEEKRQKWQDFMSTAITAQIISFLVVTLAGGIAFFVKIYPILERLSNQP